MGNEVIPPSGGVESVNLREALEERYLAYALSTIMHRALPDVRDGLKPVHRRLLYAMRLLKLDPGQGFKKCARVVGDVMGKFHPHGDQAIYDAMVRLAQDFSVRYPLVEGQGNFGNIDGDNAAAMRYTEARLTDIAKRLLDGIDEDAVDFRETYDGEDEEPIVLPGGFPNLLANGSSGIAVGMATSIPPHNAAELCIAARHLIKHPNATIDKLVDYVPGPDFPTGGIIVDSRDSIVEAYTTGRGGFRVRSRWHQEDHKRGTWVIVVTEIPYQVQKARLIEKIAELLQARRLPLLADIRDESAEDVRIVLEPRARTVDPALMMESLFKLTDLESRIPLNMNVLSRGQVPNVLGLRDVLLQWLEHRREVLVRRARHRLGKIEHRLEVLGGYLIAYLNLDEVIRIIREEDEPKKELMRVFELTDVQAEAILNMRLRALRKLEELEIRKEHEALTAEKAEIEALLGSEEAQWKKISDELTEIAKAYGPTTELGKRRTDFGEAPEHQDADIKEAMIEREPITVVVSEKGWIRALKGHGQDLTSLAFKQGDKLGHAFPAETTDKILVFSTGGRFYTLSADRLPGGRGHGEPVRIMVDMDQDQDVVAVFVHRPGRKLLVAATDGRGFVVAEDEVIASTRKGKQVLTVTGTDEAKICRPVVRDGVSGDTVAVVGQNRKLLIFPLEQVPEMGRGRGVRLQRYKDGGISDVRVFSGEAGLTWSDSAGRTHTRSLDELTEWRGERAQAGRIAPTGFPRGNRFGDEGL
ncbi:topoisomerase-4 subunit A [Rhodobium orientis]|uniref:DNA topoisomerase 4 subunit A n=1 Tax=Rhodobium orientis TaxID=34017 RepID=A0A327JM20_9HYPH|nr:DNA topoisomerase IV subunit A [Rhodobium orientis]MBB4304836.1 topoisomerase-4 subunit A [Rhodobium orientis]MBK5947992.1 DNA topoisomerase IV subunit A [Rhodobium orientis]RAI27429.1 DNA topoisomerase IV subunit A [Rhodobium orientis]